MLARTIQIGTLIVLGVLAGQGDLLAQATFEGTSSEVDRPESDQVESQRPLANVVLDAEKILKGMKEGSAKVASDLAQAIEDKDVIKSSCLSAADGSVTDAVNSGADRVDGIRAGAATGNRERVDQDWAVLNELDDSASEFVEQAGQCIGIDAGELGESDLSVTFDSSIPTDDTARRPEMKAVVTALPSVPPATEPPPFNPPLDWIGDLPRPISPTR